MLALDGRMWPLPPLLTCSASCDFLLSMWEVGIVIYLWFTPLICHFPYSFLDPSCSRSVGLSSVCQCPCLEQAFAEGWGNSKEAMPCRQKAIFICNDSWKFVYNFCADAPLGTMDLLCCLVPPSWPFLLLPPLWSQLLSQSPAENSKFSPTYLYRVI